MDILTVTTKQLTYPIYYDKSFDFLKSAVSYAGLTSKKAVCIVDSNVKGLYLKAVSTRLSEVFSEFYDYTFDAGEASKNLDTIRDIYAFFLEKKLDRKSVVFALGGGVTGDMAGFAAATFMRGVPYAQIPTTLLAQVDSGVGGKVGVDFKGQKNFIGAFYQPRFVYVNVDTLATLPKEQFTSGLGECIKHGLIRDAEYYRFIREHTPEILSRQPGVLTRLIENSCRIKAEIVQKDEREEHLRKMLNFGHTFGHAIESLSGFEELHGHCVAHGMRGGLYLSHLLGKIGFEILTEYDDLLRAFEFPHLKSKYEPDKVYGQMFNDKKADGGQLQLVALQSAGSAFLEIKASKEQVMSAIEYMLKGF